jgi:hypothetical protein
MIKAYFSGVSKPRSLESQIRDVERQVLQRQQKVGIRTTRLVQKIHQQLTAPTTLLLAGGIGFIMGELTARRTRTPDSRGNTDKPQVAVTSPLTTALNLITSVRTLYMALPIAWIMKSFNQPGAQGRQAPNRQSHPAHSNRQSSRRSR